MKVAIVIEQYKPAGGGNERSTEQIARRLLTRGHDVTLLTNRLLGQAPDDLADRIIAADGPRTTSAIGLWRFIRWAERQLDDYDTSLSVTLAVPATIVQPRGGTFRETLRANILRRPNLIHRTLRQVGVALSPKQLLLLRAEYRTLNHPRVRRIIAISHYVADQLFEHYTIPSRRIDLIPNAAVITPWPPTERAETRQHLRTQWAFDDDHVVFLFAALNPGLKGLPQLIDAMARAKTDAPAARLVVAGCFPVELMRHADAIGIGDAIRWVGPTGHTDALYAAADVTVLPSFYDPASKVVIESLLHGVPAITTRFNGASQWIIDPTHGNINTSPLNLIGQPHATDLPAHPIAGRVIDRADNINQLARAITELCNPDERARCAAATGQLDPRLNMDNHVDALEKVIIASVGH